MQQQKRVVLEDSFFSQNDCEKEHSVLRTGEFYAFTDNGESESSDSDDTDTTVELSGKSSAAGPARLRVIRAFVSEEGLKPHVLLQTIVSQEELFSLRIQDCHTANEKHYFGNTYHSISVDRLTRTGRKIVPLAVSTQMYIDLDKKCTVQGSYKLSFEKLRKSELTNHNISFYHILYKRCTAHVIGEFEDDSSEGVMTFIRYYYRHDEPDVVAADSTQKLLDDALKGRTYFKKVPRLWSNHFAVTPVKNPKLEDTIRFCLPENYTHLEVCCFYMFKAPSNKIVPLPSYLLELRKTVTPLLEAPAEPAPKKNAKQTQSVLEVLEIDTETTGRSKRTKKRKVYSDMDGNSDDEGQGNLSTSGRRTSLAAINPSTSAPATKRPKKTTTKGYNKELDVQSKSNLMQLFQLLVMYAPEPVRGEMGMSNLTFSPELATEFA